MYFVGEKSVSITGMLFLREKRCDLKEVNIDLQVSGIGVVDMLYKVGYIGELKYRDLKNRVIIGDVSVYAELKEMLLCFSLILNRLSEN